MREIILWGATGRARVLRNVCDLIGIKVVAIFDRRPVESPFPDVSLYVGKEGFAKWLVGREGPLPGFTPAIGFENCRARAEVSRWLESQGLDPVTLIHPMATVSETAVIGRGVQISIGSIVDINVKIGDYGLLGTAPVISHDCTLGIGVHLAPGATLAGEVVVGDYASIGTNATVLPRVHIGADAIIGAGAVVIKDVPERAVVVGNPARILRMRDVVPA